MIFFRNAEIYTTTFEESENDIGQLIKAYMRNNSYMVNIQPIDEKTVQKIWGSDIESTYQMYFEQLLKIGDVISWNNKAYEVEKVIPWNDYNLYAIKEMDVIIN